MQDRGFSYFCHKEYLSGFRGNLFSIQALYLYNIPMFGNKQIVNLHASTSPVDTPTMEKEGAELAIMFTDVVGYKLRASGGSLLQDKLVVMKKKLEV